MAYCVAADVKRIIPTSMDTTDITELITLADKEIDDRELNARSTETRKLISMLLTADLIVVFEPVSSGMGGISSQSHGVTVYRKRAEALIRRTGEPPIYLSEDPIPT